MKEADFYDTVLSEPDAIANLRLDDSPWLALYKEAAERIGNGQMVIDLGCGTGCFAELLARRGHKGGYLGLDFSAQALKAAKTLKLGAEFRFERCDLRDWQGADGLPGAAVFVCLEVLEHLDDDQGLVAAVPPGHRLLGSVPNYDSEAHVRTFASVGSVWQRFGHLLALQRWQLLDVGKGGRAIHLFEGTRRNDSWD